MSYHFKFGPEGIVSALKCIRLHCRCSGQGSNLRQSESALGKAVCHHEDNSVDSEHYENMQESSGSIKYYSTLGLYLEHWM